MPMARRAPLLVVLAAFVLLTTAVCPRGMLRALAISELDLPAPPAGVVLDEQPGDNSLRLPGVRVSVAREDDESSGESVASELVSAATLEAIGVVDDGDHHFAAPTDDVEPCTGAPSVRPCGNRAPPAPV